MQLVAIDTTSAVATVALFDGDVCVAKAEAAAFQGQAEALLPLIEKTLDEAKWDKRAVGTWVACAGPGSFTGIRIALATVRGICLATGAKGVSVSAFAAVRAAQGGEEAEREVAIVIPGLPGEYFCEVTKGTEVLMQPTLCDGAALAEVFAAYPGATRVEVKATSAEAVGRAFLRYGGDEALSPLYIAPPRITIPKAKTFAPKT